MEYSIFTKSYRKRTEQCYISEHSPLKILAMKGAIIAITMKIQLIFITVDTFTIAARFGVFTTRKACTDIIHSGLEHIGGNSLVYKNIQTYSI